MMTKTIGFLTLAVFVSSASAQAQSPLAEAARREAERRKAMQAAPATYTNDDLAKLPVRATPVPPRPAATDVTTLGAAGTQTPPAAAAEAGAAAPGAAAAPGPRDEKYWRERITTARANLSRAEIFAESLQSRINALSTDFVNRDDPAQRQRIAEQRQRALDELARVTAEVTAFKQQIAEIEDEARRLGLPPGWLR